MESNGIIALIIIINTCIFSIQGIRNHLIIEKYRFNVDRVILHKEYWRILTSGLVHVNWMHLILNMFILFLLSGPLEAQVGPWRFLLVYLVGLTGGNMFALLIHRKQGTYSSVGASGAINAVLFAAIALIPGMGIGLFFLPISIPGWLFAILYVSYSIYGVRSSRDNVGHEAHLGGALAGVLVAIAMHPAALVYNLLPVLVTVVPIIIFIWLVITRPHFLLVDNFFFKKQQRFNIDQEYNLTRRNRELLLDEILDKIQKKGIQNLTKEELRKLKEYSEQL
jgi:membrane associated rhomboid family serine protease